MLLSMTGFGEAKTYEDGVTLVSEVRTVNNRFLKTTIRLPDRYAPLESQVESLLRRYVERGTVHVCVKMVQDSTESDFWIDTAVMKHYIQDLTALYSDLTIRGDEFILSRPTIGDLLQLPGVVRERQTDQSDDFPQKNWQHLSNNLTLALERLQVMRRTEGESMLVDLRANSSVLLRLIGEIEAMAPQVVEAYRARLVESVGRIMGEQNLPFAPADVVREVALFADKTDVSEEMVRFRSHLKQFDLTLSGTERCGKKLDFLVQEMNREVNTIGSKGNSSEITKHVVEMKSVIERIREMIQNIE